MTLPTRLSDAQLSMLMSSLWTAADPPLITQLDNGSPGTIADHYVAHHTISKKSMLHDAGIDMYSPDSIAPSPQSPVPISRNLNGIASLEA